MSRVISKEEVKIIEKFEEIGSGACATLYKNGDKVYKIIKDNARGLYRKESLEKLAGIKSKICVFPKEILKSESGLDIGYIMDFVSGRKMREVCENLSFKQLQQAITDAERAIEELAEQGIIFDDMHFDNMMWDEKEECIKIIDTDFFKVAEEIGIEQLKKANIAKFNTQMETLIGIRDGGLAQYLNRNSDYIQFYKQWFKRGLMGEQQSSYELIDKIKSIAEKDFKTEFTCLSEIVEKLSDRVKQYEEEELDIENWSEGNEHLRNLLRSCRDNHVPSMYCYAGHRKDKPAYITVQMNEQTIGKIYHIMAQVADRKEIAFRFAQKEYGKEPSFTVYLNDKQTQDEIMDVIAGAMSKEEQCENLPEMFQMLAQISDNFVEEQIGFDLEYQMGKKNNRLLLENLRVGNGRYIGKSDLKKAGLKPRKDMFGKFQYVKNGMNQEKSNKVLSNLLTNLTQNYDIEQEKPKELNFGQRIFQKVLRTLPFINRQTNRPKLLSEAPKQANSTQSARDKFMSEMSKDGEYKKLSEIGINIGDKAQSSNDKIDSRANEKNDNDTPTL